MNLVKMTRVAVIVESGKRETGSIGFYCDKHVVKISMAHSSDSLGAAAASANGSYSANAAKIGTSAGFTWFSMSASLEKVAGESIGSKKTRPTIINW